MRILKNPTLQDSMQPLAQKTEIALLEELNLTVELDKLHAKRNLPNLMLSKSEKLAPKKFGSGSTLEAPLFLIQPRSVEKKY